MFDGAHLKSLIKMAIRHKGVAFIDVLQPCVTFNDVYTADFYRKAVYKLDDDLSWDPIIRKPDDAREKLLKAMEKSLE